MRIIEWKIKEPLTYIFTGKFEAPSEEWMHEDFPLIDFELIVITKGNLYIKYQEEKFELAEGEVLILPPSPPPNNRRIGFRPSDCSFYWLHFSVTNEEHWNLQNLAKPIDKPNAREEHSILIPQQAKIPTPEKLLVLMRQLQDAVKSDYPQVILNYFTTTILGELHSQFATQQKETKPTNHLQKQLYYDIIDYVKLNAHKCLKVVDIAQHFGYNEKYLSNQFSNIAGIPLKRFILTNKMDMANFLLSDTNKSIAEVSDDLGYSDIHNFCKAYKKICGLTPSEYRNAFSKRMLFHQ